MPGSGKSTIGKKLAVKLGLTFLDLDEAIVQRENRSIPEIFEKEGEAYFRKVEMECLKETSDRQESLVLATGGGAPCYYDGIDWMNTEGTTIFLDVSPEILVERISMQEERPLLKEDPKARMQKLYEKRIPIYRNAQIEMNADELTVEEVVERLIQKLT